MLYFQNKLKLTPNLQIWCEKNKITRRGWNYEY